ncbi:MAG: GAF domain-containing protein [Candidatus Sumerlaeia bacterium]|nr:GAF domain-containing protein [Candidatus Sumerlaeia bacterium]
MADKTRRRKSPSQSKAPRRKRSAKTAVAVSDEAKPLPPPADATPPRIMGDGALPPDDLDHEALLALTRQLQERVSGLAALNRITLALSSTHRPAGLLRLVVEEAVQLLHASDGVIYLVEPSTQRLVPRVAAGVSLDHFPELSLEQDANLIVEAAQSRYRRVAYAFEQETRGRGQTTFLRLAVPLISEGRTLGVVALRRAGTRDLSAVEEELLWMLAGHAAQVLHHARLYEDLEQSYRELSMVYEVQQQVVSAIDYHRVLTQIVHKLKELFKAKECVIRLLDGSGPNPIMRVAAAASGRDSAEPRDRPLASSLIDQQVMSGAVVVIRDLQNDPRYSAKEMARQCGFASMISAPLRARNAIIGTIRLYTGEPEDFSISDQKLLAAVAAQAAVAIENAELYRQIEEKNRELRESYEQLRQAQQELVRKEKLALLGEMSATVAHEIRNPLTAIRGFAQRIARKVSDCEGRVCDYCRLIVEEVDRLDRVIKDVLDFARRRSPTLEEGDLNLLIRDTVQLLQEELVQNQITPVPLLDLALPRVMFDPSQIKQVLVNLIQNARQAMGRNGTLTLATERRDRWAVFSVGDTGCGIPPENLEKIWEPFYTTRTHGTGLGLSLVRRIVEDHGGRIEVESKVGHGTTFRVFLPLREATP